MRETLSLRPVRPSAPPALRLEDGALEALKWLGLILMVLDHANKYLLHDSLPVLYAAGRTAMPLFAVTLGFSLARPDREVYARVSRRLAVASAVATAPFIALGGLAWGWWPLNIMAALLASTVICWLLDAGGRGSVAAAAAVFVVAGSSVEFWWPGILLCVTAWSYARKPTWSALAIGLASVFLLRFINGNDWALAALVVVAAASFWHWPVPRLRYLFYAFYPAHLAVLWLLQGAPR